MKPAHPDGNQTNASPRSRLRMASSERMLSIKLGSDCAEPEFNGCHLVCASATKFIKYQHSRNFLLFGLFVFDLVGWLGYFEVQFLAL